MKGKRWIAALLAAATLISGMPVMNARADEAETEVTQPETTPEEQVIIVLDPGHGGWDGGAARKWNGISYIESEINLAIAKAAREELERYANVTVYLTREGNTYVGLKERVDYAERLGATAIVSLHINSTGDAQQYGTSGAMAFVPYGQYRPLQAQQTKALAKDMLESLNTELGIRNNGMYTRRSETGDLFPRTKILADYYAIVRHSAIAKIPGFILEHAFVNNPTDCVRYFGNSAKLKALGIADAKAIAKHYNLKLRTDETGWKREGSFWVYIQEDGTKLTGWQTIDGKRYYFTDKGYRVHGWKRIDGKRYHFDGSGAMQTGLVVNAGRKYWLDDMGVMRSGFFKCSDGSYRYAGKYGILSSGWKKIKKKWYFFHPEDGHSLSGWARIDKKFYYFDKKSRMRTGWMLVDNKWYYFNSNGTRKNGWHLSNGSWYYLNKKTGEMLEHQWVKSGKKWYYLGTGGKMYHDCTAKINGIRYKFDSNGARVKKYKK